MRKYLFAAAAVAAVASPAAARDGSGYFGVEGGILFPKDQDADIFVDYETTTVGTPVVVGPADTTYNNAFGIDYKKGYDLDAIAGYDFGMFRIEGEIGYKRAKLDSLEVDAGMIADLNAALNRPDIDVAPDPVETLPALSAADFDLDGKVSVLSGMINALVDFGNEDGLSFYAGGGFGRARVKTLGESDNAWAYQGIAGVRFALSPNIDLGLKYRYFRTGKLDLADDTGVFIDGNPETVVPTGATAPVIVTTDAVAFADFEQRFRSHSLLASLIYNFGGGSVEAAPPPPPPPPPPPAPPATQTCPDGSVILATEACPVPPPPPPPPPPAPERG